MLFSSVPFLFYFLPCVLLVYFLVPGTLKNGVLLLASLLFYGWGEPRYLLVMLAAIAQGYVFGLLIEKSRGKRRAGLYLALSVLLSLGTLAYFKYADFMIRNLNALTGLSVPLLSLALPVGISFYTFQILSYTVDVYRGTVPAQRNLIDLAAYIAMFPQLIAGPIVRYADVAGQIDARSFDAADAFYGATRFCIGLAKKVLLADAAGKVAAQILDGSAASATTAAAWLGIVLYTFEIYFDFSGYSDMAIGMGRIFGFKYPENFRLPYTSRSITEFWRRWHISLGSFFRDYVYIPLGGKEKHQLLNMAVVWALTGLWHGASWNFVLWGLYFGAIIMLEKYTIVKIQDRIPGFILHIYSLFIIVFGWVIFYFTDISRMGGFIGILFGGGASGWNLVAQNELTGNLWLIIAGIVCCLPIGKGIRSIYEKAAYDGSAGAEVLLTGAKTLCAAALLVSCTLLLIGSTTNPFLYLRF